MSDLPFARGSDGEHGRTVLNALFRQCCLLTMAVVLLLPVAESRAGSPDRPRVIFDTDMSNDCDDCAALAILNKLADLGEVEILACATDSIEREKAVAASVSAINTYYGRAKIPIGSYHGDRGVLMNSSYTADLRDHFPQNAQADDKQTPALEVYRKALASAPDGSVTIVCVGFLNNLTDLLKSKGDLVSPLDGAGLVRAKVKQLVAMGGQFPVSPPGLNECNFAANAPLDTQYVVDHWPTPILFSGAEIGRVIRTGQGLAAAPKTNPVRRAFELSFHVSAAPDKNCLVTGRGSYDLTAVLAAVRDPRLYWEVSPAGTCRISAKGDNEWVPSPDRGHRYLIPKMPPDKVAKVLDNLLILPPAIKSP